MKRSVLSAIATLVMLSCQNDPSEEIISTSPKIVKRNCGTQEMFEKHLKTDPMLAVRRNEIEGFTKNYMQTNRQQSREITISIVVNVLYSNTTENISDEQIKSQIEVLNKDFNGLNSDYNDAPAMFAPLRAKIGVKFVLDKIVRKFTPKNLFDDNDIKKTARGGLDPTSPKTKLNIWLTTIGVLGYAQLPGGNVEIDGIVINSKNFGTIGTVEAPFNLGRTGTHEVGHWMNLEHIWGDNYCGDDYVADTPTHDKENYGALPYPHYSMCPGSPVEMTMNYMDYSDDKVMYMFTTGQKNRMLAVFAPGGPRAAYAM